MDLLAQIKSLVARGRIAFTQKALDEMGRDDLKRGEVAESILNATFVRTKRSRSPQRKRARERIYIIQGFTYTGTLVYTKGTIRRQQDQPVTFYILISAKLSVPMEPE